MLNRRHKRALWRTRAFGLLAAGVVVLLVGAAVGVVTHPPSWARSPGVAIPLALGAVLALAGGAAVYRLLGGLLLRRKVFIVANVAVQVALLGVAVAAANMIIARHYVRIDATQRGIFTLSPLTEELLRQVDEIGTRVRITAFFKAPADAEGEWLQERIKGLLHEYDARAENVTFETILIDRELDKARAFQNRLGRGVAENSIVFEAGARMREVQWLDVFERKTTFAGGRTAVQVERFKGEQILTAAIKWTLSERRRIVCFTTGHGERDIDSADAVVGYSKVRRRLEGENYVVQSLNLAEARSVPAECAVLVIAGPRAEFAPEEVQAVGEYLTRGGSLYLMAEPTPLRGRSDGLRELLRDYAIVLRDDIYAPAKTYYGLFNDVPHPITEACAGYRAGFLGTTALQSTEDKAVPERPFYRATALVEGAREIWGETSPLGSPDARAFDVTRDVPGPLTVVMASQRYRPARSALQMKLEPAEGARLVVVGDCDYLVNGVFDLAPGNQLLLAGAVAWLDQDSLPPVQIPAQDLDYRPLKVWDDRIRRTVMLISVVLMPLLAFALGGFVWVMRRG